MQRRYSRNPAEIHFLQADGSISRTLSNTPLLKIHIPENVVTHPDGQREVTGSEGWRIQFALIDTGTQMCAVSPAIKAILQLDPIATIMIDGVTGSEDMEVVRHPIFLYGSGTLVNADFAVSASLDASIYSVIIGMDVIGQGRLVMDMITGEYHFWAAIPE